MLEALLMWTGADTFVATPRWITLEFIGTTAVGNGTFMLSTTGSEHPESAVGDGEGEGAHGGAGESEGKQSATDIVGEFDTVADNEGEKDVDSDGDSEVVDVGKSVIEKSSTSLTASSSAAANTNSSQTPLPGSNTQTSRHVGIPESGRVLFSLELTHLPDMGLSPHQPHPDRRTHPEHSWVWWQVSTVEQSRPRKPWKQTHSP